MTQLVKVWSGDVLQFSARLETISYSVMEPFCNCTGLGFVPTENPHPIPL